jgi:hypothetical protein
VTDAAWDISSSPVVESDIRGLSTRPNVPGEPTIASAGGHRTPLRCG